MFAVCDGFSQKEEDVKASREEQGKKSGFGVQAGLGTSGRASTLARDFRYTGIFSLLRGFVPFRNTLTQIRRSSSLQDAKIF